MFANASLFCFEGDRIVAGRHAASIVSRLADAWARPCKKREEKEHQRAPLISEGCLTPWERFPDKSPLKGMQVALATGYELSGSNLDHGTRVRATPGKSPNLSSLCTRSPAFIRYVRVSGKDAFREGLLFAAQHLEKGYCGHLKCGSDGLSLSESPEQFVLSMTEAGLLGIRIAWIVEDPVRALLEHCRTEGFQEKTSYVPARKELQVA